MIKYIILIYFVVCGFKITASPSRNYTYRVLDGCRGAVQCVRSMTSAPALGSASEELSRAIERTITEVVKDALSSTTPTPMVDSWSREEITSVVSAAVKQALKDLTPPLLTPTTSTCIRDIASTVTCQERLRNLTVKQTALHCDEIVAQALVPCQLSVMNLTKSLAELTQDVAQTIPTTMNPTLAPAHCVPGYEYSNVTGHCYKVHTEPVLWPVADMRCRREGGHLAVINSRGEEGSFFDDIRNRTNHGFYIGVYKDSAGRWTTSTGEDVVEAAGYHVWYSSEPWFGEWRYGFMFRHGTIGTSNEDETLPFVCEKAP